MREGGNFGGTLVPGAYSLKVVGTGRPATEFVDFEIAAGDATSLRVESPPPGRIVVRIVDADGHLLPAKATAVGTYGPEFVGMLTPDFLFDLEAGEPFRTSDAVTDDVNDPKTRHYIETIAFTRDGEAELLVRPGEYEIVSSRGPEYDTRSKKVTVRSGETRDGDPQSPTRRRHAGLGRRRSARPQPTASTRHGPRPADPSLAAEGVEGAVSTDHNYVTDYAPIVARNNLTPWLHPMVGLEMTTLESGHFNGYPLRYDVGPITHGAFAWASRTPSQIFADMRALGASGRSARSSRSTIRATASSATSRSTIATASRPTRSRPTVSMSFSPRRARRSDENGNTTFSFDHDAMEVANGKLFWEIHHYRVPERFRRATCLPTFRPSPTC